MADKRRVRNSGIHVVVDYVGLNDFYSGSLTGFSCTVMLSSLSEFSKHQPKLGKSILGSFVSSSNGYLLSIQHKNVLRPTLITRLFYKFLITANCVKV